jgi:hypothetical protein
MQRISYRTACLLIAALLVSLVVASGASASTISGTVVHKNTRAHSFTVADGRGNLKAIHARRSPRTGRSVVVSGARRLRNGTYAARSVRVRGKHRRVRVRGIVSYVSRKRHLFVVSSRGVSLIVRRGARGRSSAAEALPAVGHEVTVEGNVGDDGEVEADNVNEQNGDHGTLEVEGVILAVDTAARTLTISADDNNESGGTTTVHIPAGWDMSIYRQGQEIELRVTRNADNTFTAVSSSSDENEQEADDEGHRQDMTVAQATARCRDQQADPNFAATHDGKPFSVFYKSEDKMTSFDKCVRENSHGKSEHSAPERGDS